MNYKTVAIFEAIVIIVTIVGFTVYTLNSTKGVITLSGAGATFPAPLYQKWSEEFNDLTGAQINYEGIGSGAGVKQFTNKTVDFGASDPPMKDSEFTAAPGTLHLPMTIGGVVVVYNIPNVQAKLDFTGEVVADIFRLNITRWNDSRLTALNPSVSLPDQSLYVVVRADSSGTTKVFTSFLSDESATWKAIYGASNLPTWPTGAHSGPGNSGVAQQVQLNQYSIGYVELNYAIQNHIPYGKVFNPATSEFVEPTFDTLKAAADSISLNLPPGDQSWASVGAYFKRPSSGYPITSFSYVLVYKELNVVPGMTQEKAKTLAWFLWWAVHDGQSYSAALSYVPLPDAVVAHDETTLRMVTFNGQQVHNWS